MRGVSDRNKKIDGMLKKIDELKSEIMLTFMRTQNLIISSYFDKAFENISNLEEVENYILLKIIWVVLKDIHFLMITM